jgi:hypothetical protein
MSITGTSRPAFYRYFDDLHHLMGRLLQTDQRLPGLDDSKEGLIKNADGSYDIYFAPKPPKGQENNWIQTVPGKGWNTILRLDGPLEPFYDKTWKPGDPELVN